MHAFEMDEIVHGSASQAGCCCDCGNTRCTEKCIEVIAELECRYSSKKLAEKVPSESDCWDCCDLTNSGDASREKDSCAAARRSSVTSKELGTDDDCQVSTCQEGKPDEGGTCYASAQTRVSEHGNGGVPGASAALAPPGGRSCASADTQVSAARRYGKNTAGSVAAKVGRGTTCRSDSQSATTKSCCVSSQANHGGEADTDSCRAPLRTYGDIKTSCCASAKTGGSSATSTDTCCAASRPINTGQMVGTSCPVPAAADRDGKESPCCSKIDVREVTADDCCTVSDGTKSTTKRPCDTHLQKALNEFAAYLEKGLCICRSVLDRYGGETCCNRNVPAPDSADTRVSPPVATICVQSAKAGCQQRKTAVTCEPAKCVVAKTPEVRDDITSQIQESCPIDSVVITGHNHLSRQHNAPGTATEIEDSAARQHVLLSVSGMTCTGCSRKVMNILGRTEGVSNSRVTFVSGTADFDVDDQMTTKETVIKKLEKETGFKCSPIESSLQTLDLLLGPDAAEQLRDGLGPGIESALRTSTGAYRFTYDPAVIGARSVLFSVPNARLAPPVPDASLADGKKRLKSMAWATVLAAALTLPILALNWSNNPISHTVRSMISLILATFVQAIAIPEFYRPALTSLIYSRMVEIDMLVVISISAAYGYSVVAASLSFAGFDLEIEAFFETSSLLITLVLFGRMMGSLARVRAVGAVSVRSLQGEKALLVLEHSRRTETEAKTVEIDACLLQIGDVFLVKPHGRIVTDGTVVEGQSSVDESMVTGESTPVPKTTGDSVVAGTINGRSPLVVHLTRLPGKNSITDIASLIEGALAAKPRVQDLADRVASWFVPVVIVISLVVFVIWLAIVLEVRDDGAGGAFGTAITYAIAVLAVSCPCAIGLAVPLVLVIAGGVGARSGIIIKSSKVTESAYKATDVLFDKTGTLTNGELEVQEMRVWDSATVSRGEIISLARSLTKQNDHPVSRAVHAAINEETATTVVADIVSVPGCGVRGVYNNVPVKAGNPFWLGVEEHPTIAQFLQGGLTLFCLSIDYNLAAVWTLKSTLRPEARSAVRNLHERGITCHIVSGDNASAVRDVAVELQIPLAHVASHQSPAEKQMCIRELQLTSQGPNQAAEKNKVVLFVGDGTNDAAAVAQADVGVHIASGTINTSDMTRATADVVLLGGLEGVPALLDISRRAVNRIRFNFIWSAVYNLFAILLAAGAFVRVRIPPAYAGLGEIVSIVPVVVAAITLVKRRQRVASG